MNLFITNFVLLFNNNIFIETVDRILLGFMFKDHHANSTPACPVDGFGFYRHVESTIKQKNLKIFGIFIPVILYLQRE